LPAAKAFHSHPPFCNTSEDLSGHDRANINKRVSHTYTRTYRHACTHRHTHTSNGQGRTPNSFQNIGACNLCVEVNAREVGSDCDNWNCWAVICSKLIGRSIAATKTMVHRT
jgi:hypothetical protein